MDNPNRHGVYLGEDYDPLPPHTHDPSCSHNQPRYEAHFTPEAWIRDQATEVDAEGPQTWDCTVYARENIAYLARCARDRGESLTDGWGVVDNDDVFMGDPAAPGWVRDWRGPFTIRIMTDEEG